MEVNNLDELYEHTHTPFEDRVERSLHLILSPPFKPTDLCWFVSHIKYVSLEVSESQSERVNGYVCFYVTFPSLTRSFSSLSHATFFHMFLFCFYNVSTLATLAICHCIQRK